VFDQLARAGFSVHPGEHAGICGGIDHGVDGWDCLKVAGGADVSVEDFDAERFEFGAVCLAAGSDEIVEGLVQFRGENGEFALTELNRCYHCDD
jgi:hypothetical protein